MPPIRGTCRPWIHRVNRQGAKSSNSPAHSWGRVVWLMPRVAAFGAGLRVPGWILVEAGLAAGRAEVVGLAFAEGSIFGGRRIDRHPANRIDCRALLAHVFSLARLGLILGWCGAI